MQYGFKLVPLADMKRFISSTFDYLVFKASSIDRNIIYNYLSKITLDYIQNKGLNFIELNAKNDLNLWI